MNGDIRVVDDVPAAFAATVEEAFRNRSDPEGFSIALSGGSTAAPCYEALSRADIDWSIVTVVWGDDRAVDANHDDSNYFLAEKSLLSKVGNIRAVHRMDYEAGADAYNDIVKSLLPIDVVHLGMGDDGHTASLFPGNEALNAPPDRFVVETGDEFHKHRRLSFTYAAIAKSNLALFTVVGSGKREMFGRIRNGEDFPAAHVTARSVVWLVDPAAAA